MVNVHSSRGQVKCFRAYAIMRWCHQVTTLQNDVGIQWLAYASRQQTQCFDKVQGVVLTPTSEMHLPHLWEFIYCLIGISHDFITICITHYVPHITHYISTKIKWKPTEKRRHQMPRQLQVGKQSQWKAWEKQKCSMQLRNLQVGINRFCTKE